MTKYQRTGINDQRSTVCDQWPKIDGLGSMTKDQRSWINDQRSTVWYQWPKINGLVTMTKDQRSVINDQRSTVLAQLPKINGHRSMAEDYGLCWDLDLWYRIHLIISMISMLLAKKSNLYKIIFCFKHISFQISCKTYIVT